MTEIVFDNRPFGLRKGPHREPIEPTDIRLDDDTIVIGNEKFPKGSPHDPETYEQGQKIGREHFISHGLQLAANLPRSRRSREK